jgi:hypothetical protein
MARLYGHWGKIIHQNQILTTGLIEMTNHATADKTGSTRNKYHTLFLKQSEV